ncbi:MAG: cobyrinate a,c-diamide synthase [Betaproteobacteria bacterium]|nr:cobyrinate a,c-diamide synthase [Betaproteobacteria bacterium]PWB58717.1 MAG: cobyrinic acid a,c-diamide synthase [Betaproteobacteria bacterium]
MSGLLISAAWRSSGKTTVATGLVAELAGRGLVVQPFKKGPDYIDPQWLGLAAGRTCRNLDLHLQGDAEVASHWAMHSAGVDVAVVEGNLGLHDGLDLEGSDSNAALARKLQLPVVLVLNSRGMARGAAALLHGLATFDPTIRVAGVILNRVSGARHEGKLRAAIERYTRIPVLGAIGEDPRLGVVERHLGLVPAFEAGDAMARIAAMREAVCAGVDVDAILAIARTAAPVAPAPPGPPAPPSRLRIGIARDRAFGFYYPDDIDAFRAGGAELVAVDTLRDRRLPEVDGLFIGGGFPEVLGEELAANGEFRASLRDAIEAGLPVYAECGGLMYLARSLSWRGRTWEMVGALPADVVMHAKPVGKGYVRLVETGDHPWGTGEGTVVRAHEFHYSTLAHADPGLRYAFRVERGAGTDGRRDGIVHRNVLATYAHQRSAGGNDWVRRFLAHVAGRKAVRAAAAASA